MEDDNLYDVFVRDSNEAFKPVLIVFFLLVVILITLFMFDLMVIYTNKETNIMIIIVNVLRFENKQIRALNKIEYINL